MTPYSIFGKYDEVIAFVAVTAPYFGFGVLKR